MTLICEIYSFLDCAQLFKGRALYLNKKLYSQKFMIRQATIRHLGVLEDYFLEREYISKVTGKKFEDLPSSKNYEQSDNCFTYLHKYPRKHDHKIMLFGYQSVGGSLHSISENGSVGDVKVQNKQNSRFNQFNVRHLFVDSPGYYNSSAKIDPCIATGIFFQELDHETEDIGAMEAEFKAVRGISEEVGYSVLRGLKEHKVSIPTEHLE